MPGFKQLVQQSWAQLVAAVNKDRVMHIKLARLAKTLKRWNKQRLKSLREEADEAQQRVLQLDQTHDQRPLNDDVVQERRTTKNKILALATVQKIRLRLRSRLTCIRVGDANTKLFHLKTNARRQKNFIPSLQVNDQVHTTHEAKAQALHDFYKNQFGSPNQRQTTLNWVAVQMNRHDLSALDRDIEDEETEAVIRHTPSGYVGLFYKSCWPIIKDDVTRAIRDLFAL
jgi:hypothetical protein